MSTNNIGFECQIRVLEFEVPILSRALFIGCIYNVLMYVVCIEYNLCLYPFSAERVWYIKGEQGVAKYNETVKNTVELHMGVFRVPEFDTDILITFNDPINIE